jgi:hypothetical protein
MQPTDKAKGSRKSHIGVLEEVSEGVLFESVYHAAGTIGNRYQEDHLVGIGIKGSISGNG